MGIRDSFAKMGCGFEKGQHREDCVVHLGPVNQRGYRIVKCLRAYEG